MKKEIVIKIKIIAMLIILANLLVISNDNYNVYAKYEDVDNVKYYEAVEKEITIESKSKNEIKDKIKYLEEDLEGIGEIISEPTITNDEVIKSEIQKNDYMVYFGEDKPMDTYPYHEKIGNKTYSGILKLDKTISKYISGPHNVNRIIKINRKETNISTRKFDAKGKYLGVSYSWDNTNNHYVFLHDDKLFIKESAEKISSVRKNNPDGSYSIADTWEATYFSIIKRVEYINHPGVNYVGYYNGKIKTEEHIYTYSAKYKVQLQSQEMKESNNGNNSSEQIVNDPVNIVTGNLFSTDTDLELLDLGMSIDATRYYNAQDERKGILGQSWRFNYESYIQEMEGNNNLKVIYPNGRTGVYIYNEEKSEYEALPGFYDQLIKEDDGTYTLTLKNKTKYFYNINKKLSKIKNIQGNEVNLIYNSQNQLIQVKGALGKYINITYDQGKIIKITDSLGRSITYTYNNNLIEKVIDDTGAYTKYTYEGNKIKSITDKNGKVYITNDYDEFGRVIRQTDGNGGEINYDYNIITKENYYHNVKTGEKIRYQYNKRCYITKKIYEDGTYEEYTYDEKGNKKTSRNRNGYVTTFIYDDRNNIVKIISPEPHNYETKLDYDENDNVTKITRPNGVEENYTYDSRNNLTEIEKQLDKNTKALTTFTYDDKGRRLSSTNPLGYKTSYQYNDHSPLPIKVIDPEGNITNYTYDNGNRVKTITKDNSTLTYEYDYLNNITKVTDQNGNITRMKYDKMGNLIKSIKPNQYNVSTDDGIGTIYKYNDMDKIIKTIDPLGNIYANQYDNAGNLAKVINPNTYDEVTDEGEGKSLIYDTNKRLIKTINPSGAQARIKYDPLGNVLKSITANNYNETTDDGEGISFTYDSLNRITAIKDKDGNTISKNIYDEVGNILKTVDSEGYETLYKYNDAGWLLVKQEPLKEEKGKVLYRQTRYKYDLLGRVIKEYKTKDYVLKDGRAEEYNIINYSYNKNNQIIKVTDSSGANIQYKYNNQSQLVEQKTKVSDDVFSIKKYVYDKLGRIIKEIQVIDGEDIGSTNEKEEAITDYTYDKNGNLTQIKTPLGYKTIFTYDANNRIIKKDEEVEKDWLNETHVKANIYSHKDKIYENNIYTYNVNIDTTEKISDINLNIKYDPRVFDIEGIEKENESIEINTNTIGQISISSSEVYNIGKTDILKIKLRAKSQIIGLGYVTFTEESTYKNQNGEVKPFSELTGQRLDITGPDFNQNKKVEINDLTLAAQQISQNGVNPNYQYKYDTNNDGKIDADDLTYISEWLDHNNSNNYKKLGISQIKNKIINTTYAKGSDKVIRETSYEYDKAGNLIKETDLEGSIEYTYDEQNNLIKQTDKEGNIYSYKYDEEGNVIREIKPENYNEETNDGKAVSYTYDYLGRLTVVRDEENRVVQKNVYNSKGKLIQQIDPKGYQSGDSDDTRYKTEYLYDIGGRLISITTPELKQKGKQNTTYTYDAQDNIITITDAEDNVTKYVRDLWGRAETIINAKGNSSRYTYDYAGNLTSSIDPKGNKTKYVYNSQNRLKTVIDPQGKEIKYLYDLEARVIKETDRAGQDINYKYNRDNNLIQKSVEGKNQDQYYLYNQIGRLQATISNNGIERYNYNKNGLITDKIMNNETILSYKYNANNQIKSLTDIQGNTINYTYDSQARIKEVKENTSTLATYNYKDNQLDAVNYNNGISINYHYNKDNQVTVITHKKDSNQILNTYEYIYDLNGNIIEKQENQQSTKYEYDQLYQLTKVNYPNNIEEKYTYDVSGNRQKRTLKEPIFDGQSSPIVKEITTNYQYNNLNQLTKSIENDIITTYSYDKNGNLINENNSKSGTIYYNYDAYNRLINVTKPDGQYQTNYYTVGNLRKAIEENGVYTGFTYNDGQVVSEHNSYGEIRQNIIRGYQQIATKDDTNQINYYLHNVHGDITSIVNSEGKMLNEYNYDAYGNITSKEALVPNRYNYAGEQYDNVTGQYYLRARYYNPTIGRFIQEDSYRGDGLNLYTYVQNNPVNLIDPTGYCSEKNSSSESEYIENQFSQYDIGDRTLIFANNGQAFLIEIEEWNLHDGKYKGFKFVNASYEDFGNANKTYVSPKEWASILIGFTPADTAKDFIDFIKGEDSITGDKINRWLLGAMIFTPEIVDMAIKKGAKNGDEVVSFLNSSRKSIDDILVPSVKNGEFDSWFNNLTVAEFDEIWANPKLRNKIKSRLRHPGGLHEWHMVSRTNVFKKWGVTAEQIKELRTAISDVKFVNPPGVHGGLGSTKAHNEILEIIDNASDYDSFKKGLREWANNRLEGGVNALPEGLR
ncbi:RHS repeat-associated core domain-containing protein [Vallitalea guaymasensis]|uniref:RHS repeat-associated core domain-containing protein n=1 Tax=Vallitalea guaymasensis TaxID=1185412 RepID=UPI000DE3CF76|nr:RHS repeat-associated core domain-containing protein [Vallitalea guaymasensis]